MADHTVPDSHSGDMDAHRSTYEGFITGSIALSLVSAFILVALVAFRFAPTLNVLTGFAGLILGLIAIAIDVRGVGRWFLSGRRWFLSGGLLVLFGLITAINVS